MLGAGIAVQPLSITLAEPTRSAVGPLRSRYAAFLLQGLAEIDHRRRSLPAELREPFAALLRGLAGAHRTDRRRVADVVLRQNLSTLANCAMRGHEENGGVARALAALVPLLAFELGLEALLPASIAWGSPVATLFSIAHDVKIDIEPSVVVDAFAPDGILLRTPGRAVKLAWTDLRPGFDRDGVRSASSFPGLSGSVRMALYDNNPLVAIEEHPDKAGNRLNLDGHPVEEWLAALKAALDLVEAGLPEVRREMDALDLQIVPVGYHTELHFSASYMEDIGTAYLSLHPSALTLAEALVHEFQHNKINLARNLDPVLTNGFSSLHSSPVRPDPRPLMGVLLAVHAFVPVAQMYLNLRRRGHAESSQGGFDDRLRRIVAGNAEGLAEVRRSAEPTALGTQVIEELTRWQAAHEAAVPALGG